MPKKKPNTSDVNRDQIRGASDRAFSNNIADNRPAKGPGTMKKMDRGMTKVKKMKP